MAYQQINIVVALTSHLVVLVYYLANLIRMYQQGGLVESRVFTLWAVVIIATIIITIVGTILTAIMVSIARTIKTETVEEERFNVDERDKLIDLRGVRVTYFSYSIGVFLSMLTFVIGQPPLVMFSLLILFGIIGEIIGDISKLYLYRKGA
jgi:hypothetical protein